jgi:CheY-like chemotaxis protein
MPIKFLIVEDDSLIADLLQHVLHRSFKDAEVQHSSDNEGAYSILRDWLPSLVITDIMHPGGDGYELLSKLRKDPRTWSIPVMVMSGGHSSNEDQLRQYRHGFNAVLPKPSPVQEMIVSINQLLHLHASPDAAMIHAGYESPDRDYKVTVDLQTKAGRASLAKDVIAMSNYGGGTIIIGVSEDKPGRFLPMGIPDDVISICETTRLNRSLRVFMDPHVQITVRPVKDSERSYLFMEVPAANDTLILAAMKNEMASLYPGRIYTRTNAAESAEVQTAQELRHVLARFINKNGHDAVSRSRQSNKPIQRTRKKTRR